MVCWHSQGSNKIILNKEFYCWRIMKTRHTVALGLYGQVPFQVRTGIIYTKVTLMAAKTSWENKRKRQRETDGSRMTSSARSKVIYVHFPTHYSGFLFLFLMPLIFLPHSSYSVPLLNSDPFFGLTSCLVKYTQDPVRSSPIYTWLCERLNEFYVAV